MRFLLLFLLFSFPVALSPASSAAPRDKSVWNYDGGIMFATDGVIKDGPCIRINGHVSNESFFENLRREDSSAGTFFRRGNEVVTLFPESMHLTLVLTDRACDIPWEQSGGPKVFLTKEALESLRIRFFWKHGVTLRNTRGIELRHVTPRSAPIFPGEHAADPELVEWWLDFDVPSKGVPLTDSLVIVLVTANGDNVARVAARL